MSRVELRIRGVPEWLLRAYLAGLGAVEDNGDAARMTGDGYAVSWSAERAPLPGGTLSLTQLNIRLDGDAAAIAALEPALMAKLQRGGG
ncbi:MAG: DUF1952 domain-containing protein [Chloroflexota bacterium]|nr:DUF1952 domain-containing protein [Chloroflexota bacterium]